MRFLYSLLLVLLLISCGPAIYVDYDKKVNFAEQTTYQFHPEFESGLNQLDDKRIMRALDSSLVKRGYSKTDYCQYYVAFYAEEYLANSRNTLGIGIGSGGGNVGVGVSGGIPLGGKVIHQRLTVEVIAAYNDHPVVWEAVIEGELKEKATPKQKEAYYYSVIEKAFKKFPPKK